jgi:hypothetical protein
MRRLILALAATLFLAGCIAYTPPRPYHPWVPPGHRYHHYYGPLLLQGPHYHHGGHR